MSSITDIANMAVGHVGDDTVIVNIIPPGVDRTPVAGYCSRFYGAARRTLIELFPWRFATRRVVLTPAAANPSTAWQYAYIRPSDSVKDVKILSASGYDIGDLWNPERTGARFDMQNGLLLTDEPEAVLVYRVDVLDPTKYTSTFELALSYMLGSLIAGPVVKGSEGINLAKGLRELALTLAATGAELDANTSTEDASEFTPSSVAAR